MDYRPSWTPSCIRVGSRVVSVRSKRFWRPYFKAARRAERQWLQDQKRAHVRRLAPESRKRRSYEFFSPGSASVPTFLDDRPKPPRKPNGPPRAEWMPDGPTAQCPRCRRTIIDPEHCRCCGAHWPQPQTQDGAKAAQKAAETEAKPPVGDVNKATRATGRRKAGAAAGNGPPTPTLTRPRGPLARLPARTPALGDRIIR
jgi:hypothetical protein